jgi:ribosomal protein L9
MSGTPMKLILTQEVTGLGGPGDVVDVAGGYGRNYLVPRGLAMRWTRGGEKQIEQIRRARSTRAIKSQDDATAAAATLASMTVSVTPNDVARAIGPDRRCVDRHDVTMDSDPLGRRHEVKVHLFAEVDPGDLGGGHDRRAGWRIEVRHPASAVADRMDRSGCCRADARDPPDVRRLHPARRRPGRPLHAPAAPALGSRLRGRPIHRADRLASTSRRPPMVSQSLAETGLT